MLVVGADFVHLRAGGQGEKRLQVAGDGQPVEDPVGSVIRHLARRFLLFQIGDDVHLGSLRRCLQSRDHSLTTSKLGGHQLGGPQVGLLFEVDDVGGFTTLYNLALACSWDTHSMGIERLFRLFRQLLENQGLDLGPHLWGHVWRRRRSSGEGEKK